MDDVEKVISFKFTANSDLLFFIKWENFDESDNTWEPIENLVLCTVFRDFVNQRFKCEMKYLVKFNSPDLMDDFYDFSF